MGVGVMAGPEAVRSHAVVHVCLVFSKEYGIWNEQINQDNRWVIENRESLTELGVVTPEIMEVLVDSMAHGERRDGETGRTTAAEMVSSSLDGRTDGWTETRKREVSADEEDLLRLNYLFMEGEGSTRVYTGATPAQGLNTGVHTSCTGLGYCRK